MAGLLDRLFGGSNNTSNTTAVAEQTGATASSPFLQYLQKNQGAARSTAESLMGPKPEADYSMPLAMMGLSILGQQPGGAPPGTIARGAAGAMPYFMQEKEKQEEYDKQARDLAMKLGMKDYEIMSSIGEGTGLKDYGGNVIHEPTFKAAFQQSGDMEEAFRMATVITDRGAPEKNADALASKLAELEQLKGRGADPDKIQQKQDEIYWLQQQLEKPESSNTVQYFGQDEDGNFTSISGPPGEVMGTLKTIQDEKTYRKLKTKQQATDDVLGYSSRIIEIMDNANDFAAGRLGGMASSLGAWGKAIENGLSGPKASQFKSEVGDDPLAYLERLKNDPEAENYMNPGLYNKLSEIGQENAQLLSNVIGLGYATARAADEGGRLSNSDVAFALQRIGFDVDKLLNDPEAVKAGVLEQAASSLRQYESMLEYEDPALLEKDRLFNKRIDEYGFEWTGGPRGELRYQAEEGEDAPGPDAADPGPTGDQPPGAMTAPPPPTPEQAVPEQVYDATDFTAEQAARLPSGTRVRTPDGKIRVVP